MIQTVACKELGQSMQEEKNGPATAGRFCLGDGMQLTRFTDYGLRTLIYLAVQPSGKRVTISEVTEVYDLSRDHVVKVVHRLGQLGYISTIRGKGGGFLLAHDPSAINVGQVVEALEQVVEVVNCESPVCRLSTACRLRALLGEATTAFFDVLRRYTLADLVKGKRKTRELLGVSLQGAR